MRLLFIHDSLFFRDKDGKVYNGGSFPYFLWKNYLKHFSNITVFARNFYDKKRMVVLSSCKDVSFFLTKCYSSVITLFLNYKSLKNEINTLAMSSDIVLLRLPSVLGFIGGSVARKAGKKIIVEQAGNAKEALFNHGSVLGKIVAPIFHRINKNIVSVADYVVYVTSYKLQNDYPNQKGKIISISNVVIPEIISSEKIDPIRFDSDKLKIGLIGGFDVRYKGQDVLLKAVNILPADVKNNIELYFVGKGNGSWLVTLAESYGLSDNIKYMGGKESGKKIFDFLDTLSLYIQPSLTEGMPRALLEAMSRGCPVLGSDAGGIPEVINDKFIHKKGDYKTISFQIEEFYRNRSLLKSESLRSLNEVYQYSKTELDKKRISFFDEIIKDFNVKTMT